MKFIINYKKSRTIINNPAPVIYGNCSTILFSVLFKSTSINTPPIIPNNAPKIIPKTDKAIFCPSVALFFAYFSI